MATFLALANGIESVFSGETDGSVKICRPDMSSPMGAGNIPYHKVISNDSSSTGVEVGNILVKAQTDQVSEFTLLTVDYMMEVGNSSSYQLTLEGKKVLVDYQKTYRPFGSENNNLWGTVVDHFTDDRNMVYVTRLEMTVDGTSSAVGKIMGFHLIGDGVSNTDYRNEYWIFKATAPWDSSGNIKSWKYAG